MAKGAVINKVVVIGGSAGSLEVILRLVPDLPVVSGTLFIVVVHRKSDAESLLCNILSRRTTMEVKEVEDKEPILPNIIYVAPSDYHLLVEDETAFALDSSEKIHYSRPSIDVTFESVAQAFGERVIGLLLSGANADGAEGLKEIKGAGGFTMVQNPQSAEVGFMPQQALNSFRVDLVLGIDEIGKTIRRLVEKI